MTIDAYLVALRRLLPPYARFRALPETREHLRDAAARHRAAGISPTDPEVAATAEFGEVEDVARRLRSELAVRETRVAALLAVAAVAFFVFPLYVVPENSLPPAPWAEMPTTSPRSSGLDRPLARSRARWPPRARSCVDARPRVTGSLLPGQSRWPGRSRCSVALVVRWFSYSSSTPNFALAGPFALACLATCAAAAWWALSRRQRLVALD